MLIKKQCSRSNLKATFIVALLFLFSISYTSYPQNVKETSSFVIQTKPYIILEGYVPNPYNVHTEEGFFYKYLPPLKKSEPAFTKTGIEEIVLFILAKDEEDIIYANLVWHYCLGFRHFVVMNNNSSDNTLKLIQKFKKETQNTAQLILIDDPIKAHIQSEKTKSGYLMVKNLWPEVTWFFIADADEFYCPDNNLEDTLKQVPSDVDAILVSWVHYLGGKDYFSFDKDEKFYKKLHYKTKAHFHYTKSILRMNASDLELTLGNHYLIHYDNRPAKSIVGSELKLVLLHFPMRTPEQYEGKLINLNTGIQLAMGNKIDTGPKLTQQELDKKFNELLMKNWSVIKYKSIDDTMPMDQAFDLYRGLINDKISN